MSAQRGLIVVMGIDGSGKSTAVQTVVSRLADEGVDVGYLWNRWEPRLVAPLMRRMRTRSAGLVAPADPREDGGSGYGAKRRLLSNPLVRWLWLTVASGDYALVGVSRVRAALGAHELVLCDRYVPDFIVDQAMNLGGTSPLLEGAARSAFLRLFPRGDLYVLFDIDPAMASSRKADVPDQRTAQAKRELYRSFGASVGAVVIDAGAPADVVAQQLLDTVTSMGERARS